MSPKEGVFVLGSLAITTLISIGTYRSNRLLRELGSLPFNPLLAPAENGIKLVLLALLLLLGWVSGLPAHRFGLVPPTSEQLLSGLLAGTIGWSLANLVAVLAVACWGRELVSSLVIRAIIPRSNQEWPGVALAMLLAVLLEEALFRAILLGGLGAWLPPTMTLPLGAVLFGLLHSVQGRLGIVIATVLGVGLGLLFVWSGSLWPPLLAHYVINMGQLVLARYKPGLLER